MGAQTTGPNQPQSQPQGPQSRPPDAGRGRGTKVLNCLAVGLLIAIGIFVVLGLLIYAACGGFK